jgi:hypothetical protein
MNNLKQDCNSINFGYSSRLNNDYDAINDRIIESTAPLQYQTDVNKIYNENTCMQFNGMQSKISSNYPLNYVPDMSQQLIDIESNLSNRNTINNKSKNGQYNNMNVTNMPLLQMNECNKNTKYNINTQYYTPSYSLKEYETNRMFDIANDSQQHIYYSQASNTKLEATDNFIPKKQFDINSYNNKIMNIPNGNGTVIDLSHQY